MLLLAHFLRAIVAIGIGLAVLITILTAAGVAVIVTGDGEARGFGLDEILPMWLGCVALALAISRLAHLALGRLVELPPPRGR